MENVWDDVWFHVIDFGGLATKDVLEGMINELPVNVSGGILVFCSVVLVSCRLVVVVVGCNGRNFVHRCCRQERQVLGARKHNVGQDKQTGVCLCQCWKGGEVM